MPNTSVGPPFTTLRRIVSGHRLGLPTQPELQLSRKSFYVQRRTRSPNKERGSGTQKVRRGHVSALRVFVNREAPPRGVQSREPWAPVYLRRSPPRTKAATRDQRRGVTSPAERDRPGTASRGRLAWAPSSRIRHNRQLFRHVEHAEIAAERFAQAA
ncbi:hypothetical protein MRX96_006844 [Rhipicephalus microplus]